MHIEYPDLSKKNLENTFGQWAMVHGAQEMLVMSW